jgi:hypothetical protein
MKDESWGGWLAEVPAFILIHPSSLILHPFISVRAEISEYMGLRPDAVIRQFR